MREDLIREAVKNLPGSQFEKFTYRLIRSSHYAGLIPTSESHDLGQDAKTEETTRFQHGNKWVSLVASKTATLSNLLKNCQRIKQAAHRVDIIVFTIPKTPREPTIKKWKAKIQEQFGWELEVRGLNFLAATAAGPAHESLVDDYLQIPPPGGDFVEEIEREFQRYTSKSLQSVSTDIPGRSTAIRRDETALIDEHFVLGKPVLLSGEAGTGKSGIALALAESARYVQRKRVLFIDARQVAYVNNEGQLREHFSLEGPLDEAARRLVRRYPTGLRIIIDQLDNVAGSRSAEMLTDLAIQLSKTPRIEVVVVSRNKEAYEVDVVRKLQMAHFVEMTVNPLSEATARLILGELGLASPPRWLVELATNLLNLSLIAGINKANPRFDFFAVIDEVDLWEAYLEAIRDRECLNTTAEVGGQLLRRPQN